MQWDTIGFMQKGVMSELHFRKSIQASVWRMDCGAWRDKMEIKEISWSLLQQTGNR